MKNIKYQLSFYEKLVERLYPPYQFVEYSNMVRYKEDLDWLLKSDTEKLHFRIGSAGSAKKMSGELNRPKRYSIALAEVNKIILKLLDQLNLVLSDELPYEDQPLCLLRLKAILLIEKQYLDEFYRPIRHLSKSFLSEVLEDIKKDISDKDLIEQLEVFQSQYSLMYDNWENAPK